VERAPIRILGSMDGGRGPIKRKRLKKLSLINLKKTSKLPREAVGQKSLTKDSGKERAKGFEKSRSKKGVGAGRKHHGENNDCKKPEFNENNTGHKSKNLDQ